MGGFCARQPGPYSQFLTSVQAMPQRMMHHSQDLGMGPAIIHIDLGHAAFHGAVENSCELVGPMEARRKAAWVYDGQEPPRP